MSERKLFGTDGVRGVANEHPMTAEVALKLGRAIAYISKRGPHRHRIVIGKDTRISGYMLEFAIASGVCSFGVDVTLTGPVPTPAIAFLTRTLRADAGIMISASHNPFYDNGIKFFGADGFKLADDIELEMESLLSSGEIDAIRPTATEVGKTRKMEDSRGRYVQYVKTTFDPKLGLDGLKLVVDCANGAAYRVAPSIFEELGAEVIAVGTHPDGKNINDGVGAVHPERLQKLVEKHGAHAGIALDGDADRLIVVDEKGKVVDGDAVMAICGRDLINKGALPHKTVVSTVMSNIGLERSLAEVGGKVVRTQVGDRYVVEAMKQSGYAFGGEQSGHLIFLERSSTGDGCVAALALLEVAVRAQKPISELARCFETVPQVLINLPVSKKPPMNELTKVSALIRKVEGELGADGRVLVRYSGTENKARVMVEGPDPDKTQQYAEDIADALRAEIGT
ncbi:MAG: phosphoglucosamine mutase [Myxococcales bacterium]|nr:phosphoglucosamine mutase [Myxococcales bacterium]MCB9650082.1 phosphoglucosamine mutase [Deltaproteobacteria bacterium]